MPVRQSAPDRGKAKGRRIVLSLSRELEDARFACGLSYADLGKAVGISGQQAARICRAQSPNVSIVRIAGLLAAVGLDISGRAYPSGVPVRDAAHLALLARLRARIPGTTRWIAEAPVVHEPTSVLGAPDTMDRRAWDAVIEGSTWRVGVEAETRIGDVQALERRISLKQRDGNVDAVLLLVNDTSHNRRIVADEGPRLRAQFPGTARLAFKCLAAGQPLGSSTILVL
jgi:transcriptional regulator with XRE-family HTH domain